MPAGEPALLVLDPGAHEIEYPIHGRLFIGRECPGIDNEHRVVISDPEISRNHCEVRLDHAEDRAYLVDVSTNGTRLNGVRIARTVATLIRPGDRISVAGHQFQFRSTRFAGNSQSLLEETIAPVRLKTMVLVVGDIVNYSTIAQVTDNDAIARDLKRLWQELDVVMTAHRGTLNSFQGDAIYVVWDAGTTADATELAIDFALAANQRLHEINAELTLRAPDGLPIRMGWSVVQGQAAVTSMSRADAVIGDATNLAFRLSGIAGREGREHVVVTRRVMELVRDDYDFGEPEDVDTKGRAGKEVIYPVVRRR